MKLYAVEMKYTETHHNTAIVAANDTDEALRLARESVEIKGLLCNHDFVAREALDTTKSLVDDATLPGVLGTVKHTA